MEALLKELPFAGWIAAIVVLVLGAAAATFMLDGYRSKKKKDGVEDDDRLINLLQTTVGELEKKVNKQDADIKALTEDVHKMREENRILRDVLQGRDQQTQDFYKKAFEAMEMGKQTNAVVVALASSIDVTNKNITALIGIIGKHVDVIDHATVAQSAKK